MFVVASTVRCGCCCTLEAACERQESLALSQLTPHARTDSRTYMYRVQIHLNKYHVTLSHMSPNFILRSQHGTLILHVSMYHVISVITE